MSERPPEGEKTEVVERWNLVLGPEKYLSWGSYNIANHLGAALLSTLVAPKQAGGRCWRLLPEVPEEGGLCGRCAEVVNG